MKNRRLMIKRKRLEEVEKARQRAEEAKEPTPVPMSAKPKDQMTRRKKKPAKRKKVKKQISMEHIPSDVASISSQELQDNPNEPDDENLEEIKVEEDEIEIDSTGIRSIADIFADLKKAKPDEGEKESDSGGSDSEPECDDLNDAELQRLQSNMVSIIRNFKNREVETKPVKIKSPAKAKVKSKRSSKNPSQSYTQPSLQHAMK